MSLPNQFQNYYSMNVNRKVILAFLFLFRSSERQVTRSFIRV